MVVVFQGSMIFRGIWRADEGLGDQNHGLAHDSNLDHDLGHSLWGHPLQIGDRHRAPHDEEADIGHLYPSDDSLQQHNQYSNAKSGGSIQSSSFKYFLSLYVSP